MVWFLQDERLRLTNELLMGIRVVKLYAWEEPMMENIEEVRRREVLLIRRSAFVRLVAEILNMSSPIIVAIVTFTLYTLIDPVNNVLTPQIAFVSLNLFSMFRIPMMVYIRF